MMKATHFGSLAFLSRLRGVTSLDYVLIVDGGRDSWAGLLASRRDPVDAPLINFAVRQGTKGGSGAFLAADETDSKWWVKPLNNLQGERVAITEAIVGLVGKIIGAPVCDTAIVRISDDLAGWEFRPGATVVPGYAHASLEVSGVVEERSLLFRERDSNSKRHVGVIALYDWCWGGDDQWLYSGPSDQELFSHDHGYFLPDTGPTWSIATLEGNVDVPHVKVCPLDGLDQQEVARVAESLRTLPQSRLIESLSLIPESWPVSDEELEAVGWFLQRRAPAVSARLEDLGSKL